MGLLLLHETGWHIRIVGFDLVSGTARLSFMQVLSISDMDLRMDDIDSCYHLSDCMFNLDARIHFDEIKASICDEELHRSRIDIVDIFRINFTAASQICFRNPSSNEMDGAISTTF